MGNKVESVELDDETVKVDLRGNDMDGRGERCSSEIGDLLVVVTETSAEDLGVLSWEYGNKEICCGAPQSVVDWGDWRGDFAGDVLIDDSETVGFSAVGHVDSLRLDRYAV